tara:strand:- start:12010 stop:12462 length:453 start_codon:yes stop_codon:yes gene_type:complete
METGYTVDQVMTRDVLSTSPDSTILECAVLMAEKELGSTVVLKEDKVIGILTEQDLARKVMARKLDPTTTKVEEVMTKEVSTVSPEEDVYYAMVQMGQNKIKHLPVIKDSKLQGIISFKDVIKIQPDLIDLINFKSSIAELKSKNNDEDV